MTSTPLNRNLSFRSWSKGKSTTANPCKPGLGKMSSSSRSWSQQVLRCRLAAIFREAQLLHAHSPYTCDNVAHLVEARVSHLPSSTPIRQKVRAQATLLILSRSTGSSVPAFTPKLTLQGMWLVARPAFSSSVVPSSVLKPEGQTSILQHGSEGLGFSGYRVQGLGF